MNRVTHDISRDIHIGLNLAKKVEDAAGKLAVKFAENTRIYHGTIAVMAKSEKIPGGVMIMVDEAW